MIKISEAVGYSVRALGVSPSEFFKILEEVKTRYDDKKYSHWLAKKVIDYAENNGVAYNELFTKKVRILNDLAGGDDITFNDKFTNFIKLKAEEFFKKSGEEYTSISTVPSILLDKNVKFSNDGGIDLGEENLVWLEGEGGFLGEVVKKGESALVVLKAGDGRLKKENLLLKNAKQFNIQLINEFDSLLYRLITAVRAVDCSKIKFAILSDCKDFADKGKEELFDLFMQYLKCEEAFLFHPLEVSDSLVQEGYFMLSFWSVNGSYSQGNSCFGLQDSECVANVVDCTQDDFPYIGFYNFTFPEKDFSVVETPFNLEELKKFAVHNVAKELLNGKLGFSKSLKEPVNILSEYKILEVFSVLLEIFSEKPFYGLEEQAVDFVKSNYGVLSVEAVSFLEFCEGAMNKAKEIGIDEKNSFLDTLKSFCNNTLVNEFLSRRGKLESSLVNLGGLDCFLA